MSDHDSESDEIKVLFSRPFLGACSLCLVLCGVVVGLWSHAIERDLDEIRNTLNDRASLIPRTAELEKRLDDQEGRLRAVERQMYFNGRH